MAVWVLMLRKPICCVISTKPLKRLIIIQLSGVHGYNLKITCK